MRFNQSGYHTTSPFTQQLAALATEICERHKIMATISVTNGVSDNRPNHQHNAIQVYVTPATKVETPRLLEALGELARRCGAGMTQDRRGSHILFCAIAAKEPKVQLGMHGRADELSRA